MCGSKEDSEKDKDYDPSANGPIKNRSCTDCICCLLFIVCVLGMGVCSYFGYKYGDPVRLLYPTDSDGNLCGFGSLETKPNLVFFDLVKCGQTGAAVVLQGCPTPQVCVESCPSTNWVWLTSYAKEVASGSSDTTERAKLICKSSIKPNTSPKTIKQLVEDEDCASYYVESKPLVGRCIPAFIVDTLSQASGILASNNLTTLVDKFNNSITQAGLSEGSVALAYILNAQDYGMKMYQDVVASYWMILVGLGISMIISFLWIVLMRWIAGIMVWLTMFIFFCLFGFSTYYCFTKYLELEAKQTTTSNTIDIKFTTDLSYYWNLTYTWLVFGIISAVFLLIILLCIIFLRKKIMTAIALIKETSRAISNMVFTLFWPLIPFILQVALFAYWGATALYLASYKVKDGEVYNTTVNITNVTEGGVLVEKKIEQVIEAIPCNPGENTTTGQICSFLKYGNDEYTIYLQFYMLFMLFWCMNFIVAFGQMTLAGAFASYYWAFKKPDDIPTFPLTASVWRTLRYHLGTLAFGALIVAIIQMIRVFLEYLDRKLKGKENKIAKFFLACLKCFFWCLEKFIKFINKNAYILTAVYGTNFCTSAKNAFMLIMKNVVRVAVVDKVSDFVLFVCKMVSVGTAGVAAYFFFDGRITFLANYVPSLNFYLVPVIIIIIGAYVVASCFFSVYGMGVDTLFLCFLEDLERNDGSPEKPFYMSKDLKDILGKKNKKKKVEPEEAKKE